MSFKKIVDRAIEICSHPFEVGLEQNDVERAVVRRINGSLQKQHCELELTSFWRNWQPSLALIEAGQVKQLDIDNDGSEYFFLKTDMSEVSKLSWSEIVLRKSSDPILLATGDFTEQLGFNTSQGYTKQNKQLLEANINEAFAILESTAGFLDGVTIVTKGILPTFNPAGNVSSGSSSLLPGLYHLEICNHPFEIAETLVHECSHQWYFIVERICLLINGSDTSEYYSPFRRKNRNLRTILQTYHAFANVLIFYNKSKIHNKKIEFYNSNQYYDMIHNVQQLEKYLDKTNGLTSEGALFYRHLKSRLRSSFK